MPIGPNYKTLHNLAILPISCFACALYLWSLLAFAWPFHARVLSECQKLPPMARLREAEEEAVAVAGEAGEDLAVAGEEIEAAAGPATPTVTPATTVVVEKEEAEAEEVIIDFLKLETANLDRSLCV